MEIMQSSNNAHGMDAYALRGQGMSYNGGFTRRKWIVAYAPQSILVPVAPRGKA